ncbi:rhomboid family intramembrane serine protease [Myxococcota bacterium]|nr:rhomboid family intramembrane serine protease [Myxococcota bacterium]
MSGDAQERSTIEALVRAPMGPFELVTRALVLQDPSAVVLQQLEPDIAVLMFPARSRAVVLFRGFLGLERRLEKAVAAIDAMSADLRVEVGVVGGPPELRTALGTLMPGSSRVEAFHLADDGTLWRQSYDEDPSLLADLVLWPKLQAIARGEPVDPGSTEAFVEKATLDAVAARQNRREAGAFVDRLQKTTPRATYAILTVITVMFGLEHYFGGAETLPTIIRLGALVEDRVLAGEWWRLVSCGFLHGGFGHLLMNGYVLLAIGPMLEPLFGTRRFVLVFGLSLVGGSLAAIFAREGALSVGASGALWGLLGAEAILAFRPTGLLPAAMIPRLRRGALINLGLNVAVSFLPRVDAAAHFGGGAVGALLVLTGIATAGIPTLDQAAKGARERTPLWLAPAHALMVAILAASVVAAVYFGRPWELTSPPSWVRAELPELGMSIEVPTSIVERRQVIEPDAEGRGPRATHVLFGDGRDDAVTMEIFFVPFTEPVADDQLDAALDQLAEHLAQAPKGHVVDRAPERRTFAGRPGLAVRHRGPASVSDCAAILFWDGFSEVCTVVWAPFAEAHAGAMTHAAETLLRQ